jgi:cbb3-type cytochrome oxidase subunit 3
MTLDQLDAFSREGALIFFLLFFLGVVLWLALGPDQRFQHDAQLPLDEERSHDD